MLRIEPVSLFRLPCVVTTPIHGRGESGEEEDSYNMICGIEAAVGSSNLYRATWHFAGGDEYVDGEPALGRSFCQ